MTRVAALLALAALLLAGCSTAVPTPPTAGASLPPLDAGSLRLPSIDPAVQGCPVTVGRAASTLGPFDSGAVAVGAGPVYAETYGPSPAAAISFYAMGDGWHYAKVPFFSRPGYRGPILIRGGRIDGTGPLRFDGHPNRLASLELTTGNLAFHPGGGWRGWPTGVLVQSRGCYVLQIDGSSFSTMIVFLALVDVPASPLAHRVAGGCGATTAYAGDPPQWLVDAACGRGAPSSLPYVSSASGLIGGFIFGYPLRAGAPENPTNKILWAVATARNGSPLDIEARRQGSTGPALTFSFPDNAGPGEIYPSIVDVPSPGCWTFTLSWGTGEGQVQLAYV